MTEKQPPTRVPAAPNSRLAQLIAEYAELKPTADEIATRLKLITDALKFELAAAAPNALTIETELGDTQLRLTYQESWRLDAKRMKAEAPETYVRYAKKSGSWSLRQEH